MKGDKERERESGREGEREVDAARPAFFSHLSFFECCVLLRLEIELVNAAVRQRLASPAINERTERTEHGDEMGREERGEEWKNVCQRAVNVANSWLDSGVFGRALDADNKNVSRLTIVGS